MKLHNFWAPWRACCVTMMLRSFSAPMTSSASLFHRFSKLSCPAARVNVTCERTAPFLYDCEDGRQSALHAMFADSLVETGVSLVAHTCPTSCTPNRNSLSPSRQKVQLWSVSREFATRRIARRKEKIASVFVDWRTQFASNHIKPGLPPVSFPFNHNWALDSKVGRCAVNWNPSGLPGVRQKYSAKASTNRSQIGGGAWCVYIDGQSAREGRTRHTYVFVLEVLQLVDTRQFLYRGELFSEAPNPEPKEAQTSGGPDSLNAQPLHCPARQQHLFVLCAVTPPNRANTPCMTAAIR